VSKGNARQGPDQAAGRARERAGSILRFLMQGEPLGHEHGPGAGAAGPHGSKRHLLVRLLAREELGTLAAAPPSIPPTRRLLARLLARETLERADPPPAGRRAPPGLIASLLEREFLPEPGPSTGRAARPGLITYVLSRETLAQEQADAARPVQRSFLRWLIARDHLGPAAAAGGPSGLPDAPSQ